MRLNSLHNGLYAAAKLLRAELIAVKLLPGNHVDWTPTDIAVGDTSQLQQFAWQDGGTAPEPRGCLRQHQPLFGVADALSVYTRPETNSVAVEIAVTETILDALPGQFLLHERRGSSRLQLGSIWFALTLHEESPARGALLDPEHDNNNSLNELIELLFGVCSQTLWSQYRSAMLQLDSSTELPGAAELRHQLQLNIAKLRAMSEQPELHAHEQACSLLVLVEINDFPLYRRTLGGENTEHLLRQSAETTRHAVRKNDGVYRFSPSAFAVTAEVAQGTAAQVVEKIRTAWLNLALSSNHVGLTFSLGYTLANANDDQPVPGAQQFLMSAEHALAQARHQGTNIAAEANLDWQAEDLPITEATGGVFTSDPMKDYRNSRILWHATSLIAAETDPTTLCQTFTALLQDTLGLTAVDIYTNDDGVLSSASRSTSVQLEPGLAELLQRAIAAQKTQTAPNSDAPGDVSDTSTQIAVPLVSRHEPIGALLLDSSEPVDDSDQIFLRAIADQIAGALDRIELAQRQEALNAHESASLRAELKELRDSTNLVEPTPVVAASKAMRDVLAFVAKIAPTDASVLIMGESGAGKEVMAKAIVAASNRAAAPLITVDCSAIAHSLIDSELFGRVKGAFTGADDASPGRIADADGGTLFLDEIGELPMDVQAKLLRFVQEKELIAVGDTRKRRIDARIICATNRDLLFESSQGRFRSDLYYRLQVLQVTVPPLRERLADINALATSFAERYSEQFGKSIQGFTDEAWQKINGHNWPGNVRELQNAIVRATLTAETDYIDASDLQFGEELPTPEMSVYTSSPETFGRPRQPAMPPHRAPEHQPDQRHQQKNESDQQAEYILDTDAQDPASAISTDDWQTLTALLAGQVSALINDERMEAPLGRWLADTVVLTAAEVSDGVARQAARLLGVPETTLRRQLTKARQNEDNPFQLMSRQWLTTLPALTDLLRNLMREDESHTDFSERCQALLLQQVANHIGDDRKVGAALMGITPPTYARWIERFEVTPQPIEAAATTTFKLEQKYS